MLSLPHPSAVHSLSAGAEQAPGSLCWLAALQGDQGQGQIPAPEVLIRCCCSCLLVTLKVARCGQHLQLQILLVDDLFLAIYFRALFMCSVQTCSIASAIGDQITLCLGEITSCVSRGVV